MAKDIAENFEISKSLVCRSVDSLIKKGYIDTKKDEKDKSCLLYTSRCV